MPTRQCGQVLSEYMNGATTKSPGRTLRTSAPTSSTIPTNSWPMRVGSVTSLIPRYGHRSLPQTHAAVTRTRASVGLDDRGVGDVLDADVAGGVEDGGLHASQPPTRAGGRAAW